jgi:exodeoxyribonuclease VIII
MNFSQYSNLEAVNWSTLKHMAKSPLHYRYAMENPSEDTVGRLKGRGTHTAVLEIERFMLDYACYKGEPGKKVIRRGKHWDAFKEMHDEENILKIDEYEHCIRAAKAVRAHSAAAAALAHSQKEVTIQWTDEETGIACKARLDILDDSGIFDLKGIRCAELGALSQEVAKQRYHCQLAFYQEGCKRDPNIRKTIPAHIIGVENAAPHDVVVAEIAEDDLYAGWETVRGLLDQVAVCRKSGQWPGRYAQKQTLRLPQWIWESEEELDVDDIVCSDADKGASAE